MLNPQFIKNFSIPELKYIAGKRYINLFILSCILIISMLAIGLGNGAIKYLDKKMNNPFVSFVNVKIPMGNPWTITEMRKKHEKLELDKLNGNELRNILPNPNYIVLSFEDYFGFSEPYPEYIENANFSNYRDKNITPSAKVRRGTKDDPIYEFILENDNNLPISISKNNNFNPLGWGCVVSLEFLKNDKTKLNYVNDVPFLHLRRNLDGDHKFFSIPIEGVVNSFPNGVDIIAGEKLFESLADPNVWISLYSISNPRNNYLQFYVNNNDTLILDFFKSNSFVEIEYDDLLYNNGKMLKRDNMNLTELNFIKNKLPISNNYYRVFDFYRGNVPRDVDQDKEYFVFQFQKDRLASIEKFNSFLKLYTEFDNKTLSIDMSVIESKKNFDLFNKLANLLSMALIIFSIFSIILYITNLIISHISKNKMNLGTLKAFGLSNNSIILIYSSISIALITSAFIFSYFISALIGNLSINFIAQFFDIGDSSTLNYISDPIYYLISFFIIIPSLCIYFKLWLTLRNSTPGDLIYGRD